MTLGVNQPPEHHVADLLATPLSLTLGTNLFIGLLPDDPMTAVCVYGMPGAGTVFTQDHRFDSRVAGLQIVVRDVSYESAWSLMENIREVLRRTAYNSVSGQNVSGSGITVIYGPVVPTGEPVPLGWDHRRRFSFNMSAKVHRCRQS